MAERLTEATLREAIGKLEARTGQRDGLVLHPHTYAWAERRGFIEDGVVDWARLVEAYLNERNEGEPR